MNNTLEYNQVQPYITNHVGTTQVLILDEYGKYDRLTVNIYDVLFEEGGKADLAFVFPLYEYRYIIVGVPFEYLPPDNSWLLSFDSSQRADFIEALNPLERTYHKKGIVPEIGTKFSELLFRNGTTKQVLMHSQGIYRYRQL